jgi:hypothetical protein
MKRVALVGLGGVVCGVCVVGAVIAVAGTDERRQATGLVREVREATRDFLDVHTAMAAGYGSLGSCVTGPQEGAMGIHYGNGELINDGDIDAEHPELLIYELRGGRLRLVGVEFLVLAEAWDAKKIGPPVLMGQHFQYVGSPNRYGLPAFYELHVWAWRDNVHGTFVDWNPAVSCDEYTGETSTSQAHGGHH